jgi:hypothetical protein
LFNDLWKPNTTDSTSDRRPFVLTISERDSSSSLHFAKAGKANPVSLRPRRPLVKFQGPSRQKAQHLLSALDTGLDCLSDLASIAQLSTVSM